MSLQDGAYNRDIDDTVEVDGDALTKRMIYLSKVMDHFWRRWKKEYLLELRDSHRYAASKGSTDQIAVGDMVVVHETGQPRGYWKLARVENLIVGADGRVWGARVRTQTKSGS